MMTIHFIRPLWLLTFFPAVIYLIWTMYFSRQHNPWRKVCDPHLLAVLIQPAPSRGRRFFHIASFLFFSIAIIALAGPAWEKAKLPVYQDTTLTMLVVDLSPAMMATDLKPDRLTRAKLKIRDLLNAAHTIQAGLVVFTSEPFVAAPISQDANTLSALLDELHPQMMPVSGSDIGGGLTEALKLLKQTSENRGNVLLITASDPTGTSLDVAKEIAQAGYQLNILAMMEKNASTQTTLDHLHKLAREGGGALHVFSSDGTDIQEILKDPSKIRTIKDDNVENAYLWKDMGPWCCLLLLPFALVILREKVRHEKYN